MNGQKSGKRNDLAENEAGTVVGGRRAGIPKFTQHKLMVEELSFSIYKLAGRVGDFGTIFPLAIALPASGALSISPTLLFLGI